MSVKSPSPASSLYEQDFAEWLDHTARLLRDYRLDEVDVEHLIEEIAGMSASEKHDINSRVRVILLHLLKWHYQSAKRSRSWLSTITVQRAEIRDLLKRSPSLKLALGSAVAYRDALDLAMIETGLPAATFPSECPFTPAEVLDSGFLPD